MSRLGAMDGIAVRVVPWIVDSNRSGRKRPSQLLSEFRPDFDRGAATSGGQQFVWPRHERTRSATPRLNNPQPGVRAG
jgi:hypothetical protein